MPPRIQRQLLRQLPSPCRQARNRPAGTILSPASSTYCPGALFLQGTRYASTRPATSPFALPDDYVPPTQPPSAKRPELRKSQLLRSYTSMLRSSPLLLLFQHNNITATEWTAIRRELAVALSSVPAPGATGLPGSEGAADISSMIKLQVIRPRIFDVALKIVEFFDGGSAAAAPGENKAYNHDLSKAAFSAVQEATSDGSNIPETSTYKQLNPLMVGPIAVLTFPALSPDHLAAALSILSPSPPAFPAPTRRKRPSYHEPVFQNGIQKLLLVGGRIEGKVFDTDGVRWVGGIAGGLDTLRPQLVAMLQSAGIGLTSTLEAAGKSLYFTMESRKTMLEDEGKGEEKKEEESS